MSCQFRGEPWQRIVLRVSSTLMFCQRNLLPLNLFSESTVSKRFTNPSVQAYWGSKIVFSTLSQTRTFYILLALYAYFYSLKLYWCTHHCAYHRYKKVLPVLKQMIPKVSRVRSWTGLPCRGSHWTLLLHKTSRQTEGSIMHTGVLLCPTGLDWSNTE